MYTILLIRSKQWTSQLMLEDDVPQNQLLLHEQTLYL